MSARSANPASAPVPMLETERLILRARTVEDFDAYAAAWADERVWRFITGAPIDREAAWRRFIGQAGHWALMGFGYWAVAERAAPDRYVGEVGFADFKREITPSLDGAPDAGWMIVPDKQGNGYAKEALAAAHAWWDETFPGRRTAALIAPKNVASLRLAEGLGYAPLAETVYHGLGTVVLERAKTRLR